MVQFVVFVLSLFSSLFLISFVVMRTQRTKYEYNIMDIHDVIFNQK